MGGLEKTDVGFSVEQVDALCGMARYKRVMLKVGVIHDLGFTDVLPLLRRVVDAFGPDRCMWESDSGGTEFVDPERDYLASIDVIRKNADFLSKSDKEQILFRTAEDFFFNR
jgi:predicted TIM-barrel fold metal-dependent hydrolase